MTIYKAIDLRPKFAGHLIATVEPNVPRHAKRGRDYQHRPHNARRSHWLVVWASGRAPDRFEFLSDAKGYVERFYHNGVEWVEGIQ